jgi:hypothetical protein
MTTTAYFKVPLTLVMSDQALALKILSAGIPLTNDHATVGSDPIPPAPKGPSVARAVPKAKRVRKAAPKAPAVAKRAVPKAKPAESKEQKVDHVYRVIADGSAITASDISKATGIAKGPLRLVIASLRDAGRVFKANDKKKTVYGTTQAQADQRDRERNGTAAPPEPVKAVKPIKRPAKSAKRTTVIDKGAAGGE